MAIGMDRRRWNRWRIAGWSAGAALVLLPLAAMGFTDEVAWGPEDFAFATALVAAVGAAGELAVRSTASWTRRAAAAALAGAFGLVWVNAAVGLIGGEGDPANRLYPGVLAVAIGGAALARFRPAGMARAMLATAAALACVPIIALLAGWAPVGASALAEIAGVTLFFATPWLLSAWLFRRAAREPSPG